MEVKPETCQLLSGNMAVHPTPEYFSLSSPHSSSQECPGSSFVMSDITENNEICLVQF